MGRERERDNLDPVSIDESSANAAFWEVIEVILVSVKC